MRIIKCEIGEGYAILFSTGREFVEINGGRYYQSIESLAAVIKKNPGYGISSVCYGDKIEVIAEASCFSAFVQDFPELFV
jgi:hypothetical protein